MKTKAWKLMFLLDTSASQFQFADFNPNDIARVIISTIVGLMTVGGIVYGGIMLFLGFQGQDPKEKRDGVITMVASLVIGGLIITVTNMIIA